MERTADQAEKEAAAANQAADHEATQLIQEVSQHLKAIVQRTKLRPLCEQSGGDFVLQGVEELLQGKTVSDRLDDPDVSALVAWVRILCYRPGDETSNAAERLAAFIDRQYAPDDFFINTALHDMYGRQSLSLSPVDGAATAPRRADAPRDLKTKIADLSDRLDPVIQSWLDRDPVSYAALTWAPNLTDGTERERVLDRARERQPQAAAWYHARIGDFYGHGTEALLLKALAAYQHASSIDSDNPEYRARLASTENAIGNIRYSAREFEPAVERYRLAIKHDPKIAVFHGNLAGALQEMGRMAEAEEAYRAAILRAPTDASFEIRLGNLLRELKRWDHAARAYRAAIELEEDNASHENALGNMFYAARKFEDSAACYRAAISKEPKVAVYHSNLGGALRELEQTKDAEGAYMRAIALEPKSADWPNLLGNLYFDITEEYGKSLEQYQLAIALDAKQAVYHYNLAGAFARLDRWTDALHAYGKAIELQPDNASIRNGFGFALFGHGDHARAVEEFQRAVQLDPSTPVYHSNLARGLELLKKHPEALSAAEEGARRHPENPEIAQVLHSLRQQPAPPSQGQSRDSA